MKLIQIKKTKGKCSECTKKAIVSIEDIKYCSGCGDSVLLMNVKLCIEAVQQAYVKISVMPKKTTDKINKEAKSESRKKSI